MTDPIIHAPISKIVEVIMKALFKPFENELQQEFQSLQRKAITEALASLGGEGNSVIGLVELLEFLKKEQEQNYANATGEFDASTHQYYEESIIGVLKLIKLRFGNDPIAPPHPSERDASLGEEELYCTQKDQVWIWKKGEPKPLFQAASYFYAKLICKELNAGCSHPSEREVLLNYEQWKDKNVPVGLLAFGGTYNTIDRYLAEKSKTI